MDERFEGLVVPEYCPRGRDDCKSLSQIIAGGHASFVCCGVNDGSSRKVEQDRFTVCWKNAEIDDRSHWSERDLKDHLAVLNWALATDCAIRGEQ